MAHRDRPSPPAVTYAARPAIEGHTLTCTRCKRVYAYPEEAGPAVRCECGWRYENRDGMIFETFRPRIGV